MAGELKIRDVRAAIAESPFRWVIVQVEAEPDLTGIGETWYAPGVLESLAELKPIVVGEDARNVEALMTMLTFGKQSISSQDMDWAACVAQFGIGGGAVAEGPSMMALAGFETALWDLVGKALGTPAYTLFGGAFRTRIPMYADLHLPEEAPDFVASTLETALAARETGFETVKVDADLAFPELHGDPWNRRLSAAEIERTATLVSELRESLGPEVEVAVDCHFQLSASDAIRLAEELEPARPLWLEDPVPYGNPRTLAGVARASRVPICFGEYVATLDRLYPYLAEGACHIIHPDVCYARRHADTPNGLARRRARAAGCPPQLERPDRDGCGGARRRLASKLPRAREPQPGRPVVAGPRELERGGRGRRRRRPHRGGSGARYRARPRRLQALRDGL